MKQEPVTASETRKVDLSIMSFYIFRSTAQCLKDVDIKQRKNEQY